MSPVCRGYKMERNTQVKSRERNSVEVPVEGHDQFGCPMKEVMPISKNLYDVAQEEDKTEKVCRER